MRAVERAAAAMVEGVRVVAAKVEGVRVVAERVGAAMEAAAGWGSAVVARAAAGSVPAAARRAAMLSLRKDGGHRRPRKYRHRFARSGRSWLLPGRCSLREVHHLL